MTGGCVGFASVCLQKRQVCRVASRPDSQPSLAYALAQDKGFVWHLKWCPAGGWELPSRGRQVGALLFPCPRPGTCV